MGDGPDARADVRVAVPSADDQHGRDDSDMVFGRKGHPTPLGQAFAEYGRIDETMHLLPLFDPIQQAYREGQEDQLDEVG